MNIVDDIISALDLVFMEQPPPQRSIMALHGEMVRINDKLWKESPVLRKYASDRVPHKPLAASKSALEAVNRAHQDGIFPAGIRELYELLAAASELRLGELISESVEKLRTLNAFDESVDLPPELSVDTVMRVFKVLLDGPLRTIEIYESQLSRIARYCANDRDVMTNAMNALRQSLGRFRDIHLGSIPASFQVRTLPVAIYKRKGELQTAVIIGAEVRPVNLFGNRINLGDINGNGFYLKYGVYLLYLCGRTVCYKYLSDYGESIEVLSNCCNLLTKGNFVLAAQNENKYCSIFLWTDDVKFEKIYHTAETIRRMEFDPNTRLLAVAVSQDRIRLFKLENRILHLLEEIAHQNNIDISLSGGYMFMIEQGMYSCWASPHRVAAIKAESRIYSAVQDSQTTTNSYSRMYHLGGSYFPYGSSGLYIALNFPSLSESRLLMTCEELVAVSELVMSP